MLQTQLINLIPDPQGFTMRPPNKAAPTDCSGRFARMMQEISAASPGEISSLAKQPPEDIKTEEQPLPEQNPQLFLLALAPPIEQISSYIIQPSEHSYEQFEQVYAQFEYSHEYPAQAGRIMEVIVSILEGTQDNIPVNTEIAPLLAELEQITRNYLPQPPPMGPAKEIPPKLNVLPQEVTARMPLPEETIESAPNPHKLQKFIEALRGYLSPLENENDTGRNRETVNESFVKAKIIPLKAPEHMGRPQGDTNGKTDDKALAAHYIPAAAESFVAASHRAAFADSLNAAAAPRSIPFTPENIFTAMVERIVSLPGAEPHMEISLKPDHLGKVHVELLLGQDGLTAKIAASDEGVRNMLSAHINSLSETLAEKGIRVANVEITYAALADQPFGQRQPEQHKQKQSGNERAASVTNLHESAADWWDIDYDIPLYAETGLGLSSVEYRA